MVSVALPCSTIIRGTPYGTPYRFTCLEEVQHIHNHFGSVARGACGIDRRLRPTMPFFCPSEEDWNRINKKTKACARRLSMKGILHDYTNNNRGCCASICGGAAKSRGFLVGLQPSYYVPGMEL